MALLLTCLSYYYHGLTDAMLLQTINRLGQEDDPDLVYERWIRPCREDVPIELRRLSDLHVESDQEAFQRLALFLRFNKDAIDFFLNTHVFPKEAKEFPHKLSVSGWDLATRKNHATTGFSGTSDTQFLLPTTIRQSDSSTQLHTNAKVLDLLLRDENKTIIPCSSNSSAINLLNQIKVLEPEPRVFLDVGAQVLDKSNEEFSLAWLAIHDETLSARAVIYFDTADEICVITRDGFVQRLMDSPFQHRLGDCLVYLDQAHTRGTDLKLPACRAVVTLGPKLTRDNLVQGE
jgi:hypothetical protein